MKPTTLSTASFAYVAAALLSSYLPLRAAPGDLDTTFNANIVRSGGDTIVGSIAIQPDGKILTAGIFHSVGGQERLGLARINADSSLDTTFSNSQINNFGGVFSVPDDGKIWGAGSQLPAKYLQFTPAGSVVTPLPPVLADSINGINEVWQMLIQPNGKTILIGQFTHVGGVARRNIARLNADGTVDAGFNPTNPTAGNIREVRLQMDGKILIRGEFATVNGIPRNGLARLNEDGTLDTTFAPAGDLSGRILENSSSTVVQADGKILLGGQFLGTSFETMLRLNTDGSVDTTFTSPLPWDVKCNSIALQADGRIIISMAGWRPDGVNFGSMMRLLPDGTRDTSFALIVMGGKRIACDVEGRLLSSGTGPMYMRLGPTVTGNAGIARYQNDAATQSFTASPTRVEWLRGGSSPEAEYVYFQSSADAGLTWTPLGQGSRISGGWELVGLGLTPGTLVRGRARTSYALLENSATVAASAPEIALEHPAGTDLTDGTAAIGCGTVYTGSSSVKTFTIKNTGSGALTVTGASVTGGDAGDFTVNTTGMSGSVAAGSSTTFTVTFAPTAAGARSTTLQVLSNDADETTFDITLTGTGNVPVDGDNDGLPDAWEITHFGSAGANTGTADTDGDGMNNFGEYAFGLNPNSGDLTALPQPTVSGGLLTLTVTKQPHVAYTIVASTELSAGSFSTAGLTIITDDETTLTVRETAAGTRRFMQIRAVPAP